MALRLHKDIRAMGVLSILYGANVLLSVIVNALLAGVYGTSESLDAFFIAYQLCRSISIVAVSAVSAGLLSSVGTSDASAFGARATRERAVVGAIGGASFVVAAIMFVAAEPLATLIAPGLSTAGRDEVAVLVRLLSPVIAFVPMFGAAKAQNEFTGNRASFPTLLFVMNLSLSVGCALAPSSVRGPAIAFCFSTVLCVLAWLFATNRLPSMPYSIRRGHGVGREMKTIAVILATAGIYQVQGIVERGYASTLPTGSVTSLNLGFSVVGVPTSLLLPAMTSIVMPRFARRHAAGDSLRFGLGLRGHVALIALFAIVTMFFFFGARPLAELLFGWGRLGERSIIETTQVIRLLSLSFIPYVLIATWRQVLLASGRVSADFAIAVVGLIAEVALLQILVPRLGVAGIALEVALSATLMCVCALGVIWYGTRET